MPKKSSSKSRRRRREKKRKEAKRDLDLSERSRHRVEKEVHDLLPDSRKLVRSRAKKEEDEDCITDRTPETPYNSDKELDTSKQNEESARKLNHNDLLAALNFVENNANDSAGSPKTTFMPIDKPALESAQTQESLKPRGPSAEVIHTAIPHIATLPHGPPEHGQIQPIPHLPSDTVPHIAQKISLQSVGSPKQIMSARPSESSASTVSKTGDILTHASITGENAHSSFSQNSLISNTGSLAPQSAPASAASSELSLAASLTGASPSVSQQSINTSQTGGSIAEKLDQILGSEKSGDSNSSSDTVAISPSQNADQADSARVSPSLVSQTMSPMLSTASPVSKTMSPMKSDVSLASQTMSPMPSTASPVSKTMSPMKSDDSLASQTMSPMKTDASLASQTMSPMTSTATPVSQTMSPMKSTESPISQTMSAMNSSLASQTMSPMKESTMEETSGNDPKSRTPIPVESASGTPSSVTGAPEDNSQSSNSASSPGPRKDIPSSSQTPLRERPKDFSQRHGSLEKVPNRYQASGKFENGEFAPADRTLDDVPEIPSEMSPPMKTAVESRSSTSLAIKDSVPDKIFGEEDEQGAKCDRQFIGRATLTKNKKNEAGFEFETKDSIPESRSHPKTPRKLKVTTVFGGAKHKYTAPLKVKRSDRVKAPPPEAPPPEAPPTKPKASEAPPPEAAKTTPSQVPASPAQTKTATTPYWLLKTQSLPSSTTSLSTGDRKDSIDSLIASQIDTTVSSSSSARLRGGLRKKKAKGAPPSKNRPEKNKKKDTVTPSTGIEQKSTVTKADEKKDTVTSSVSTKKSIADEKKDTVLAPVIDQKTATVASKIAPPSSPMAVSPPKRPVKPATPPSHSTTAPVSKIVEASSPVNVKRSMKEIRDKPKERVIYKREEQPLAIGTPRNRKWRGVGKKSSRSGQSDNSQKSSGLEIKDQSISALTPLFKNESQTVSQKEERKRTKKKEDKRRDDRARRNQGKNKEDEPYYQQLSYLSYVAGGMRVASYEYNQREMEKQNGMKGN